MCDDVSERMIEDQKRILSTFYDRAQTYNSIIWVIGYAGFFSLWSLIKDVISIGQALWAALFISISLIALIFFEVYKMIYGMWLIYMWKKELIDIKSDQQYDFMRKWDIFKSRIDTSNVWHIHIWIIQLCIVVPTGLLASGIMVWSFISNLFRMYWP